MIGRIGMTCFALALTVAGSTVQAQAVGGPVLVPPVAPIVPVLQVNSATFGPTIDASMSAVHRTPLALALTTEAASDGANLGTSRALMIVGGVGLIVGAIIGGQAGTIVMVGSGIVGLYGLYEYVQ